MTVKLASIIYCLMCFAISCRDNSHKGKANDASTTKISSLQINIIDSFLFRQNYDDPKGAKKNTNLDLMVQHNQPLIQNLTDLKIIRDSMLDIATFTYSLPQNGELSAGNKKLNFTVFYDTIRSLPVLQLEQNGHILRHKLEGNRNIKYVTKDVIPGGYPEFIFLNHYYLVNGDNAEIKIYQIQN